MEKEKCILNVGCGQDKMTDSIGLDIDPNSSADIIHDMNVYPYPVESNGFDQVFAKHIIEHLEDPKRFIEEIYRVLRQGER